MGKILSLVVVEAVMDFGQMLDYIFTERNRLDSAVEDIVKYNGRGTLFRIDRPAVQIKSSGDNYQLASPGSLFIAEEND